MQLKHYQEKVLNELKEYLSLLSDYKSKYEKYLDIDAEMAKDYDFPKRAFTQRTNKQLFIQKRMVFMNLSLISI